MSLACGEKLHGAQAFGFAGTIKIVYTNTPAAGSVSTVLTSVLRSSHPQKLVMREGRTDCIAKFAHNVYLYGLSN